MDTHTHTHTYIHTHTHTHHVHGFGYNALGMAHAEEIRKHDMVQELDGRSADVVVPIVADELVERVLQEDHVLTMINKKKKKNRFV